MKRLVLVTILLSVSAAATLAVAAGPPGPRAHSATIDLYATGLNNPRGLTFGPDGDLYVAEGGLGGAAMTLSTDCDQVPGPVGAYSGGFTASISRIDSNQVRSTVIDGLPSSQTGPALGSLVSGIADVAFVDDDLYALEAGAGCSHGLLHTDNLLLKINPDHTTTTVADLSAFQRAHPVAAPEPDDFEPDGTWFSMVVVRGQIYAVEPNHGEIDRIDPSTGAITRLIDVSASQGHIVPTTIAYHGNFYLGNLGLFPVAPGSSSIFKVNPGGQIQVTNTGLTTVLGLAFGDHDRMYALESMTVAGFPGPADFDAGRVIQIDPNGAQTVIAEGFSFPTAMRMGPDGALYISNLGFGGPVPGLGQIYRVALQ